MLGRLRVDGLGVNEGHGLPEPIAGVWFPTSVGFSIISRLTNELPVTDEVVIT